MPALSRALAALSKLKNLQIYAEQCQNVLQNLDKHTNKIITNSSQYRSNESTNMNMNANSYDIALSQSISQPAISPYVQLFATVPSAAQSYTPINRTRLLEEEIAKLRQKNRCFWCKEIKDHRLHHVSQFHYHID